MARLMRSQPTVLSAILLYTLLHSINALNTGADFFQVQQPPVCQVYTLLESPVVIETLVPSNTVLSHPACGCEITVTNAPTLLSTTVTVTQTLGQNALYTPSGNSRYPPGTNIPNNPNNPTFYIVVTETESQKRRSPQTSQYLTSDGGLTTNTSEAVQVYESSGQLFTFNGAPSGTYYVNVNVESITFAPQLQSSITSTSISGYFSLSSTLEWEHKLFPNSKALFALSPEGLVKAIFNGKLPPGVKRIGLILRRVENPPPVSNPTGGSSDVARTFQTTLTQHSSPTDETSSTIPPVIHPAFSNTETTSSSGLSTPPHTSISTPTSSSTLTLSPSLSCTTLSTASDGGLPMTIGLGTLASPPNWPFSYTSDNATFDVTFGQQTTPGSLGYAELNPSTLPTDSILYYQINSTSTPSTTSICQTWGYLYHQPSGLCLTALQNTMNPTGSWLYESANLALEPCMICGVAPGLPESDQLFCAVQEDGTLGKWFCMGFMGDDVQGLGYGVLYQEGVAAAVLEKGGGDCIYVAAL